MDQKVKVQADTHEGDESEGEKEAKRQEESEEEDEQEIPKKVNILFQTQDFSLNKVFVNHDWKNFSNLFSESA